MKTLKIFLSLFVFSLFTLSVSAQLRVDSGGDVGIGTTTPTQKLDVDGNASIRDGSLLIGVDAGTSPARVEVGDGRTQNGNAYFDMIADASNYPDYGVRLIRLGANGISRFDHRGTGILEFRTLEAASFRIITNNVERIRATSTGSIGIGTTTPTDLLSVNGTASKPGGGDWGMFSDKRLKKNIKPFTDGLDEVLAINPVTYQYNGKAGIKDTEKEYVGVIAQEIEKVAPYMVEDKEYVELGFKGEDETYEEYVKSAEHYKSVDATAIRYMLVNAVKEQQAMIEEQERYIQSLEERLSRLEATLIGQSGNTGANVHSATLESQVALMQNQPNPFNQTTIINFEIPVDANSAEIRIYDINGSLLKNVPVSNGKGSVQINAGELSSGIYTYSLFINGSLMDTKKMTLTK